MSRQIIIEVDEEGRPLSIDGDPLPESYDPRYDHSNIYTWTCSDCGYRFEQGVDTIIAVKVRHTCTIGAGAL